MADENVTYDPYAPRGPAKKPKKGKAAEPAALLKNAPTEREQWEEQQFLKGLGSIKAIKSNIAAEMSDAKDVYDRIKQAGGFTKADVKWAMELEDKDASEIVATMARRLRIARMLGHGVSRQFEMFDADRTPAEDRAYEEGLAAGKQRKANANPYAGGEQGNAWQRGFNDGTAFVNRDLSAKFAGDGADTDEEDAGEGDDADPFSNSEEWDAAAPTAQAAE